MKHIAIEDDIKAKYAPISYGEYLVNKSDKEADKKNKELLLAAKEIGVIEGKIGGVLINQSVFSSHPDSDGYKMFQSQIDKLREDAYKILRKYPSLKWLALDDSETIPEV